ncbi:SDR family NAD(P)-dependent oxidoreductase [Sphingomonas sp. MMS24-JH45]
MGRAAAIADPRRGRGRGDQLPPRRGARRARGRRADPRRGRKAVALPGDLRNEAFCRKLVAEAAAQLDGLDILVNNAARQQTRPFIAAISRRISTIR